MINALQTIGAAKVIAIVRGIPLAQVANTVAALSEGGIRCVEITMDSPDALRAIENTKTKYGDRMLVGAGTVLDAETARHVILAGADFALSPMLDLPMIELCNRYGVLSVPGIFTPTEALAAWSAGAQLLKVYPASIGGPGYIRDLLGPLRQLRLLPVGGVHPNNAKDYLTAGAFAVGIGSSLVNSATIKRGDFAQLTSSSKALLKGIS